MKNKQKPLISIIMPVYNAAEFVAASIESILNQTYKNFELIIVDDASTDNSNQIIKSFKKKYPKKIKIISLKKNLNKGGDPAGNVAFAKAKGDFVARMDADDIAHPQRLQKQVNFLLKHPKIDIIGANAAVINREGRIVGQKLMPQSHDQIKNEFFVFNPLIHPTVMLRKNIVNQKLYQIKFNANNDYWTFFKLISLGKRFANLPEKLINYRLHGQNDSLTGVKQKFINSLRIRFGAVKEFNYRPSLISLIKLIGQSLIVFLLPEKLIIPLYLVIRGIAKPTDFLPKPQLPLFTHVKQVVLPVQS